MSWNQDVDFVASHGPDLGLPQSSRFRMECQSVSVAVPVCEDLGLGVCTPDKGIVFGNAAVVANPQHLADVIIQILCLQPQTVVIRPIAAEPVPITDGHLERPIGTEHDPSRKVSAGFPGVGNEDIANLAQRPSIQTSSRHTECDSAFATFWIREVHQMVLGKLGMHSDEMEIVGTWTGWRCPHRLRIQYAIADDPQASYLLGYQHRLSVRQKSDTPRVNQPRRHRHYTDPLIAAHIKNTRQGWVLGR